MKHDTIIITDKGKAKHQSLIDKLVRDMMNSIDADYTPFEVIMAELEEQTPPEAANEIQEALIEVEEDD